MGPNPPNPPTPARATPDPAHPRTPTARAVEPGLSALSVGYCGCWVSSNVWYSSVAYPPGSTSTSSPPASVSVPTGTW
jgi:hypothetical protein